MASLLRHRAAAFAALTAQPTILEARLADLLRHRGQRASPAEMRSWTGSLPILAQDLLEAGLGDVEVLLEYRLPLTSRRADVILAGRHPVSGHPSFVVVELKQWSQAHAVEDSTELVTVPGTAGGYRLHPVAQVQSYCDYLVDYTRYLHDVPDPVAGAAYLHNAGPDVAHTLAAHPQSTRGRLFTGADRGAFLSFLTSRLDADHPGALFADRLLHSLTAPSTQLLRVAADEIAGREQFVLLDEQAVAVETVLHAVETSRRGDRKTVVVITGGPGSGKSAIALSLMGKLADRGRTVVHATGSRSFTTTLRKVAGKRARTATLFKYFNQFGNADRNGLDVIVLDEAHRIRETSAHRYTRAADRTGLPQIDELLAAARVPVFLLDQHQVVRPGEMGSLDEISARSVAMGLDVVHIALDVQFRCGGSAAYVEWVQRLLGLIEGGPVPWFGDQAFDVRLSESPEHLENVLHDRQAAGYTGRMTAGYCWPWSAPRDDRTLVSDVQIGSWARPWNSRAERALPGAPPSALWATEPDGIHQVGCVYTAQGFEYDWNGVIIGPDLVWRTDRWVSRREFNRDPDFRSRTAVSDADFDRLVRNVYKVLLTRGMVGTLLYSPDPETQAFLARMTNAARVGDDRR